MAQLGRGAHVFGDAQLLEEARALEGAGNPAAGDIGRGLRLDPLAEKPDRAGIRPLEAADQVEEVLLPDPFGPMTPTISPARTVIAWPFSATTLLKDLVRSRVSRSAPVPTASTATLSVPRPE